MPVEEKNKWQFKERICDVPNFLVSVSTAEDDICSAEHQYLQHKIYYVLWRIEVREYEHKLAGAMLLIIGRAASAFPRSLRFLMRRGTDLKPAISSDGSDKHIH